MHTAIPGSQVSSVLYSVDWGNVFDVAGMTNVDFFVIMGYDYYYSGSTTAGPNDPLFEFQSGYNYTLSSSVTYYLYQGLPASKLVLGLPYYGREWSVSSSGTPASATTTGVTRLFNEVKDNTSGNYTVANHHSEPGSASAYYEFTSGSLKQCFITEGPEMNQRLDFINKRGLAGMGIWALGYDDGYPDFWDAIHDNLTDCAFTPCSGNLSDIGGGPLKNYYNHEDYTFTLSPPGASSVTVNFTSFNVENGYDYLYVYNGSGTAAPQFAGSPFTGTSLPPALTSSGGNITFRFTSDGATVKPGFTATYTCTADVTAPTTTINTSGVWQTADFTAGFTDIDNTGGTGVNEKFFQVLDNNGTEWRANSDHGFFNDNFTTTLHPDWTNVTGTWGIAAAHLQQSDEAEANSNLYASLVQDNTHIYLYHWQMNMTGTGTNRRAGLHFFCDDPTLPNRGNSYFVYYRVDSDKCQVYKVTGDVYTLMTDDNVTVNNNTWYDCKVSYDPQTGTIRVYLDDQLVSEWTDPSPLISGNSLSLRTGNTSTLYDDVKVYVSRSAAENISIGSSADMVRYQNNGPSQPSCRIVTLLNDHAGNWSSAYSQDANVDWTNPLAVAMVEDSLGSDIDIQVSNTSLSAHYSVGSDAHSGIDAYWYSAGTSPGDSSVIGWTNNGSATSFVQSGLGLTFGQTYYVNVKAQNGAGLKSSVVSSDGVLIKVPVDPPHNAYALAASDICETDSVQIDNSTTGASIYNWSGTGVHFSSTSAVAPYVSFSASGVYNIELISSGPGGSDTLVQSFLITLHQPPAAGFTVNDDTLYLPSALLACTNTSASATVYNWDFGDGNTSSGSDPWNNYASAGIYTVILVAGNGFCPQDTAVEPIVVMDVSGIGENPGDPVTNVYPNPVSDVLQISSGMEITGYEVYDALGKVLMAQKNAPVKNVLIDVRRLNPGTYYLRFYRGNRFSMQVFVKQ
jgi:PKD repeat protein